MKWIGIGCGGLFVLFLILGVIGAIFAPTTEAPTETSPSPAPTDSAPAQPKPAAEWVKVASWTGRTAKNTEPFTVGKNWEIRWNAQATDPAGCHFAIMTWKPGAEMMEDLVVNAMGPTKEASRQYQAGEFYLEIDSTFANWAVEVWDLR